MNKKNKKFIEESEGFLVLDIETVPDMALEALFPKFDPDSVKIGNIKNPKLIEAKIAKMQELFELGLVKKLSVDTSYALPVCCCISNGRKIITKKIDISSKDRADDIFGLCQEVWDILQLAFNKQVQLITYNGKEFDLPVLFFAGKRYNVTFDIKLYQELIKRYSPYHTDLLAFLCGFKMNNLKSLDFWGQYFNVGGKLFEADKVYDLFQKGAIETICDYCANDVKITEKLYLKVFENNF